MVRIVVSILVMFVLSTAGYTKEVFPHGCTPFVVKEDVVTFSEGKPTVVMLHNLSNHDLWVTHPVSDSSASAGWTSRMKKGHWSALAMDRVFSLQCIESLPGHEQEISCRDVLAVCQWKAATMPEQLKGTFWAGEDKNLSELIAYVERRGFVLKSKDAL